MSVGNGRGNSGDAGCEESEDSGHVLPARPGRSRVESRVYRSFLEVVPLRLVGRKRAMLEELLSSEDVSAGTMLVIFRRCRVLERGVPSRSIFTRALVPHSVLRATCVLH